MCMLALPEMHKGLVSSLSCSHGSVPGAVHAHPRPRPVQLAARAHRDLRAGTPRASWLSCRTSSRRPSAMLSMVPYIGYHSVSARLYVPESTSPGLCSSDRHAGRRSRTRRSASCTCWTGWPGARCLSRSWPASTPRPSASAWRRAHEPHLSTVAMYRCHVLCSTCLLFAQLLV